MKINRREFLAGIAATGIVAADGLSQTRGRTGKIDRKALVSRHNPVLKKLDPLSPLSVGNGEFAFTCDVTGFQTFDEEYRDAMPLCTMSQWGWHTKPIPESLKGKSLTLAEYETHGRKVGYPTSKTDQEELFNYLRENPHRLHLGRVGLIMLKMDSSEAKASDIRNIEQKLDLWTGIIESRFSVDGVPFRVRTAVHPELGCVAYTVESDMVERNRVSARITFPYGSQTIQAADWNQPQAHSTTLIQTPERQPIIARQLDNDGYFVRFNLHPELMMTRVSTHGFVVRPTEKTFEFVIQFSARQPASPPPPVAEVFAASEKYWRNFWTTGAAVDFSAVDDPRAFELERRVVLSQYLTAINCSGSLPPQETGLTTNSWYGKFHLEMHWWHSAQFALWNRVGMLEKSLHFYQDILPSAIDKAAFQGYKGARWPKMTDPSGRDSPSPIGPLLIWQQPHPIFYAELVYLNRPTRATLEAYREIIEETADFMASYAHFDEQTKRYVLGPPVIPAQENHPARETWNPTFELEYWNWALRKANEWRARLRLKPNAEWEKVAAGLSKLPVRDGVYMAHENSPQTFTERNIDHPSMLGALGILDGSKVDTETMRRTLDKVMAEWNWDDTWGWDYPMTAMTAARLNEPETAIRALLLSTPKNKYLTNGHNYQRPNLPLYLPGNGGLLYAIAMMAGGWKGASKRKTPGFPASWNVRAEGFNPRVMNGI